MPYNGRWIFSINLPVGVLALVVCYSVVEGPDHLKQGGAAVGQLALLRNEGGSIGTSMDQTIKCAATSSTPRAATNSSIRSTRPSALFGDYDRVFRTKPASKQGVVGFAPDPSGGKQP